jgi:peptidoglycan/LPS O-acetylase OafA/YrhL
MWAPFFGIGISFFLFLSKRVTKREYFITYALIIIFVYLKYTHLLTITCICTSLFFHFCRSIKLPSILTYFGKISYSLYLIHLPIIFTVGQILQHVNIIKIHPNLSVIILMLTAILSSIPFYYLIEKPSLLWAKKLKKD